MSRVIKFRGRLHREDGTWTSWWYVTPGNEEWAQFWAIVDRESICEYTGVQDKNGKDAYEGDIVEALDEDGNTDLCTISFRDGSFCCDIFNSQGQRTMSYPIGNEYKANWHVVGNIYEQPDLLAQ